MRRYTRIRQPRYNSGYYRSFFSMLAGPLQTAEAIRHDVTYKEVIKFDSLTYRVWARFVAWGALGVVLGFGVMLFRPDHWLIVQQPETPLYLASIIMLVCLILLQIFLIIGTWSATRSTLKSRNPVPVRPAKGLHIAFATTRAPGEPVEMVATTLRAAKKVRYQSGIVDVWLLDETGSPELQDLCMKLGVYYFSRKGILRWNTLKPSTAPWYKRAFGKTDGVDNAVIKQHTDPFYAAKSKHGNFNAWFAYLREQGRSYDILAGVDTDQVPEANYLERMLGYFRDTDVAYVVGPQVYGNYAAGFRGLVARWAESQASFFQSTIQRAGNASNSPMFVGTNYAVRMSVMEQIGGFQPCITEDMATGLAIHTQKNDVTGNRWKSVYTPDVLAYGEGPDLWGPYFTQQWRWAAGTFDTWRRVVWRVFFKLSPSAMLHYFLILTYYPITALTWLLGMISSIVYLTTGATAVLAPWSQFVSLYLMAVVMQLSLYFWNRRYNVSPHETAGSYGVPGMVLSTLTAPIYLSAFIGITIGKKPNFVVTTKGTNTARKTDTLSAFRTHIQWAVILLAALTYGVYARHDHPAMVSWVAVQMIVCLTPIMLGMWPAVRRGLANIKLLPTQKEVTHA